ncbi:hypothetical protein [Pseudomonas chlororaphis]|uniref:Lipoprotein n=1 Tax=Pseudomonas chlororaphis TaxID=587753 RepID=A0AAP9W5S8_9PSED|nr:hypothetical protein [Pseudomonas chlororaphis]AUG40853.1 hypothetical protein CXP47_13485 [Pseudomonas chlororaphis]AZD29461.1 hypothetical protein C4K23_2712 [Pseudomonas chlororaphis]QFS54944.1 hypothetical protein FD951_10405 [Pseudomonas chlororaphis subsp. aurantiaca]QNR50468.1 hypothetical protein HLB40_13385 [Pseudomonas chlororaphis]
MKNANRLSISLAMSAIVACAVNLSSTSLYLAADGADRTPGMRVSEGGSDRTPGFRVAEDGSSQTALGRIG